MQPTNPLAFHNALAALVEQYAGAINSLLGQLNAAETRATTAEKRVAELEAASAPAPTKVPE